MSTELLYMQGQERGISKRIILFEVLNYFVTISVSSKIFCFSLHPTANHDYKLQVRVQSIALKTFTTILQRLSGKPDAPGRCRSLNYLQKSTAQELKETE
jgi:hypothetical protein